MTAARGPGHALMHGMSAAMMQRTNRTRWKGVYRVAGKSSTSRLRAGAIAAFVLCCGTGTAMGLSATAVAAKATPTPITRTSSGDIPDTATYLRYRGRGYSIEYVEGWVQARLTGDGVRMSDIDSFERVAFAARTSQSLATFVRGTGLAQTKREYQRVVKVSANPIKLPAGSAMLLVFKARSAPDPVTGKQVTLVVDRYYVPGRSRLAVITLATPVGVDNVDAFRRISGSFTWTGR